MIERSESLLSKLYMRMDIVQMVIAQSAGPEDECVCVPEAEE
jgi:hypothetical protein